MKIRHDDLLMSLGDELEKGFCEELLQEGIIDGDEEGIAEVGRIFNRLSDVFTFKINGRKFKLTLEELE